MIRSSASLAERFSALASISYLSLLIDPGIPEMYWPGEKTETPYASAMILCNDTFVAWHLPAAMVPVGAPFAHPMDQELSDDRLGLMDAASNVRGAVVVGRDWASESGIPGAATKSSRAAVRIGVFTIASLSW